MEPDSSLDIKASGTGISLSIKVMPRSPKSCVDGVRDRALVIRLCAPAVEGKANAALAEYLAAFFGVRKKQVQIKVGERSRLKIVQVEGITLAQASAALAQALSC